jgi:hypothetical protein
VLPLAISSIRVARPLARHIRCTECHFLMWDSAAAREACVLGGALLHLQGRIRPNCTPQDRCSYPSGLIVQDGMPVPSPCRPSAVRSFSVRDSVPFNQPQDVSLRVT